MLRFTKICCHHERITIEYNFLKKVLFLKYYLIKFSIETEKRESRVDPYQTNDVLYNVYKKNA